jgi:hypothetical protein
MDKQLRTSRLLRTHTGCERIGMHRLRKGKDRLRKDGDAKAA